MRTIIGKSAGSTYERLHHDQKQEGAAFLPCLADFSEKRTTSGRGPKTKRYIGKARQAHTDYKKQFILAFLEMKIALADLI